MRTRPRGLLVVSDGVVVMPRLSLAYGLDSRTEAGVTSGHALVCPPGREGHQEEAGSREYRGLDALERPEVARRVVHGVRVGRPVR